MSSSSSRKGKRPSLHSSSTVSRPASSASRSSAVMIPRAASIFACARDCATSCGHSRRSKPSEVFRRRKSGCWGSWKRDTDAQCMGVSVSAGQDEDRAMRGSNQLAEVNWIAGQDTIASRCDRHNGGVGGVRDASLAQQHPCFPPQALVHGTDIHGLQQTCQVCLPATLISPHLCHHNPDRKSVVEGER